MRISGPSIGDKISILAVMILVPIGAISIIYENYIYLSLSVTLLLLTLLLFLAYALIKIEKGKNRLNKYTVGAGDGHIILKCSKYLTGTIPIKVYLDGEEILNMKRNDVAEIKFSVGTHTLTLAIAEFKKSKEIISSNETLYLWLEQYTSDPIQIESGNAENIECIAHKNYKKNIMLAVIGIIILIVMISISICVSLDVLI